jgi:hypothetical protein
MFGLSECRERLGWGREFEMSRHEENVRIAELEAKRNGLMKARDEAEDAFIDGTVSAEAAYAASQTYTAWLEGVEAEELEELIARRDDAKGLLESARFVLVDDGTLDTVLKCSLCGCEERFNFDGDADDDRADGRAYDAFVEGCFDVMDGEHVCEREGS